MATPDPGPERITETHLDRIFLVSHAGVHHGRDMVEFFVKQKVGDTIRIISILMALVQLRVAVKECSYTGETLEPSPP